MTSKDSNSAAITGTDRLRSLAMAALRSEGRVDHEARVADFRTAATYDVVLDLLDRLAAAEADRDDADKAYRHWMAAYEGKIG